MSRASNCPSGLVFRLVHPAYVVRYSRAYFVSFCYEQFCEQAPLCAISIRRTLEEIELKPDVGASKVRLIAQTFFYKTAPKFVIDVPDNLRLSLCRAIDTLSQEQDELSSELKSKLYQACTAVERFIGSDIFYRFRESDHCLECLRLHPKNTLPLPPFRKAVQNSLNPLQRQAVKMYCAAGDMLEQEAHLHDQTSSFFYQVGHNIGQELRAQDFQGSVEQPGEAMEHLGMMVSNLCAK